MLLHNLACKKTGLLAFVISLAMACSFDPNSGLDLRNNDLSKDDDDDRVVAPSIVTGSFLTYNNAKVGCAFQAVEGSAKTYDISCYAVTIDAKGNEVAASQLEKGLSFEWLDPVASDGVVSDIQCSTSREFISNQCRVTAKSDFVVLKFSLALKFKNKNREESDSVALPFAVSNAYGLVPSLPVLKVSSENDLRADNSFGRQTLSFPVRELDGLAFSEYCAVGSDLYIGLKSSIFKISGESAIHFAGIPYQYVGDNTHRYNSSLNGSLFCDKNGVKIVSYEYDPNVTSRTITSFDSENNIVVSTGPAPEKEGLGDIINFGTKYDPRYRYKDTEGNISTIFPVGEQTLDLTNVKNIIKGEPGEYFYQVAYDFSAINRIDSSFKGRFFSLSSRGIANVFTLPAPSGHSYTTVPVDLQYADSTLYFSFQTNTDIGALKTLIKVHKKDGAKILIGASSKGEELEAKNVSRSVLLLQNAVLNQNNEVIIADHRGVFKINSDQSMQKVPMDIVGSKILQPSRDGFFASFLGSYIMGGAAEFGWVESNGQAKRLIRGLASQYSMDRGELSQVDGVWNLPGVIGATARVDDNRALVVGEFDPAGIPIFVIGAGFQCWHLTTSIYRIDKNGGLKEVIKFSEFDAPKCQITSLSVGLNETIYISSGRSILQYSKIMGQDQYDNGKTIFSSDSAIANLQWRTDNKLLFTEQGSDATKKIEILDLNKKDSKGSPIVSVLYKANSKAFRCGYGELSGETTADKSEKVVSASLASMCIGKILDANLKDTCTQKNGSYTLLLSQEIDGISNVIRVSGPCQK